MMKNSILENTSFEIKKHLVSIFIFIGLLSILWIFFIMPSQKKISQLKSTNRKLSATIKLQQKLLPIYTKLRLKSQSVPPIKIIPRSTTLPHFKIIVEQSLTQYHLNLISFLPEFKNINSPNHLSIKILLQGKFKTFLDWLLFLLKKGYVSKINQISLNNNYETLQISLKLDINLR